MAETVLTESYLHVSLVPSRLGVEPISSCLSSNKDQKYRTLDLRQVFTSEVSLFKSFDEPNFPFPFIVLLRLKVHNENEVSYCLCQFVRNSRRWAVL